MTSSRALHHNVSSVAQALKAQCIPLTVDWDPDLLNIGATPAHVFGCDAKYQFFQ
jgi:hypothetical protein